MPRHIISTICLITALVMLSGCCGTGTVVVLLPDPDGKVGQVSLATSVGESRLTHSGQAVEALSSADKPGKPYKMSKGKIDHLFGDALAAQPEVPAHFMLYFITGTADLTQQSRLLVPKILAEVKKRDSRDISVIGHTDTVGKPDYNYSLSLKRAESVRDILVADGAESGDIEVTSHGESNLLVKTGDNVAEPKNRRVEVVVR